MKFTVEQAPLLAALTHILGAVERRNTITILNNVVLIATKGSLTMKGTDLDMEVVEHIPAEVYVKGCTTVGAHAVVEFAVIGKNNVLFPGCFVGTAPQG